MIVTNIPTPYRNPVFERLPQNRFHVLFCARSEGNRQWNHERLRYSHGYLAGRVFTHSDGYNFSHHNPGVWPALGNLQPEVVVTTGCNPTHLYAFAWANFHRARHVYMTDGTLSSEAGLGRKHRLVRRAVFHRTSAFVVASRGGVDLLKSYGVPRDQIFTSRLCADNFEALSTAGALREFDVMFSGRIHERKLPFLFAEVCAQLARLRGRCRALVVGDGPLRRQLLEKLVTDGVEVTYPGFVQPSEMAQWYGRARLLLFTTPLDAWGVVANEAMACGTPVLTTPHAGVAGDLVIDRMTGYVLPAERDAWVQVCVELLDDGRRWEVLSSAARRKVQEYTYDGAADGIVAACDWAYRRL